MRPVEEPAPGQVPVWRRPRASTWASRCGAWLRSDENGGKKLFVIFGEGEKAGVFSFDGAKAPDAGPKSGRHQRVCSPARRRMPGGFIAFSQPASGKFSTRYQIYKAEGAGYTPGPFGSLASLADNDNITIPDIHRADHRQADRDQRERDEALHQHHSGHAGELRHGADSRRRVRDGQPGQRGGPQAGRRPAAQGQDLALLDGPVRGDLERVRAVHVSRRRTAHPRAPSRPTPPATSWPTR